MEYILANRTIYRLQGAETASFLQGITTANIETLAEGAVTLCAMLSPQGKLLHDFFVFRTAEAYYIDVAQSQGASLAKKLKLYKMRADVTLEEVGDRYSIVQSEIACNGAVIAAPDNRIEDIGFRNIVAKCDGTDDDAYDAWRLSHALPEGALDVTDRTFLLDLGYDALGAVDFEKGCYVGQEVVARMHYKNARRRAIYAASSEQPLPPLGTEIYARDRKIGELRSSRDGLGIAVCQWETVQHAEGAAFSAEGIALKLEVPRWFSQVYARIAEGKQEAL